MLRATESAPLTWDAQPGAGSGVARQYRADAEIILFSVPLLHKKGVGDGSARWSESAGASGAALRLLEFRGRSIPDKAAGLNRFGFIQELSRSGDAGCAESMYFGLMTSSPEESVADAKKALHSNSKEASYSAIEARIGAGVIETANARFISKIPASANDQKELVDRARQALVEAPRKKSDLPSAGAAPQPFLHAVAFLINNTGVSETEYAYNGRMYHLKVERAPDAKAAAAFQESHLIANGTAVTRLSGTLRRIEGGKPIDFRIWIEQGAPRPIPLRIEYQPKSYLRLTFEAQA